MKSVYNQEEISITSLMKMTPGDDLSHKSSYHQLVNVSKYTKLYNGAFLVSKQVMSAGGKNSSGNTQGI
jgi:hypothetical protein